MGRFPGSDREACFEIIRQGNELVALSNKSDDVYYMISEIRWKREVEIMEKVA